MRNKRTLGWFLFGLGSQLQLFGSSLSFTELFVFIAAPIVFSKELPSMRRNGIMPYFYISLALVLGCIVACIANHTPPAFILRGMAVCCIMPCAIVVGHRMLRSDMSGFKWMLVGGAFSSVLCTFVFRKSVEVSMLSGGVVDSQTTTNIISGATYWIHRLGAFVTLPAKGWYLRCPMAYSVTAPLFMAAFSMLTSVSGRGSAARAIASAILVMIGGKKQSTIRGRVCQRFGLILLVGFVGAFALKQAYQFSATHGWLGEKAQAKYEAQTKGKTSMMALLMGGRMESFCGLIACADKPIVGFGPWARDNDGYQIEFLRRYGDYEDYSRAVESENYRRKFGIMSLNLIPCHGVITELWLWYGISGLLFCFYSLFVMLRYLKQDCWVVPQWYYWLGASIPGMFWDFCFNPLDSRAGIPLFVVACLLARAVRKGRQQLPLEMLREIER